MPVAPGSSITCSILLVEPSLFLSGFNHLSHACCEGENGTALLRGTLQLCVRRNTKIKSVQLKLLGRAHMEWPQQVDSTFYEEDNLQTQVLTFFNAMNNWEKDDYGNRCTYQQKSKSPNDSNLENQINTSKRPRLSSGNFQTQSSNKASKTAPATEVKWYKVFYPGIYDYVFEFPIDHYQLETTKAPFGSVKWELHATIDRAGMFNIKLRSRKELSFVRIPDPLSLEMMEPILFSRQWEDQLCYDIVISGKSFPIGSMIPIVFKLSPLDKVQMHGLKVSVTESIEYWSNDRKATRKTPIRTVLLLEKTARKAIFPLWATSGRITVRDSEFTPEPRGEVHEMAAGQRSREAVGEQTAAQPVTETRENILGNSDPGSQSFWGTTEIEALVQIPTCRMMTRTEDLRLHPKCLWKNVSASHCIKVILHISRLDMDDPTGKKRRFFDTAISLPITLLDCRANQANMNLPSYTDEACQFVTCQTICGCPDALTITTQKSPRHVIETLAAHHLANDQQSAPPAIEPGRPTYLVQDRNFNLPSFDNDITPSPIPAFIDDGPPPHYSDIIGDSNVNGLGDYFARLTEYSLN
ncbi:Arrestin-related trafficking adapter 3 [Fusarium austroafricanum]|uniref:Arrestin-related trafficking adapter 3 n=1 Tax=Fusarium austroafricanum TaxID=2364996 RepID=A0A8H4JA88_9HYPO|nr:Arrestin-related trafficking adapter 3 [Fusarium austroafricanum]